MGQFLNGHKILYLVEASLEKIIFFYLDVTKTNRNCSPFFHFCGFSGCRFILSACHYPPSTPHTSPSYRPPPPTSFTSDRGIRFRNLREVGSLAGVNNLLHFAVCLCFLKTRRKIFSKEILLPPLSLSLSLE
jgi:hypothetical protein